MSDSLTTPLAAVASLEEPERVMLSRCVAAFGPASFTLEAALAIVATDETERALVTALVDKDLLFDTGDRISVSDDVMNSQDLDTNLSKVFRDRHAAYFASRAEELARATSTREGRAARGALRMERANIARAIDHAIGEGDGKIVARLLLATLPVVLAEPPATADVDAIVTEHIDRISRALDLSILIEHRIGLLSARGRCQKKLGAVHMAEVDLEEAVGLAHRAGFRREEARLLGELGMTAYARCDFASALARCRAAHIVQATLGDMSEQAISMTELAMVHREMSAIPEAREEAIRALAVHRGAGNAKHESMTLAELALSAVEVGELDQARESLSSAMAAAEAVGTSALDALLAFTRALLDHATAVADHTSTEPGPLEVAYGDAIRACAEHSRLEGASFAYLGVLSFDRGDVTGANERLLFGAAVLARAGDWRRAALATGYLAACAFLANDPKRGAELFVDARKMVAENDPMHTAIGLIEATITHGTIPSRAREHAKISWDVRVALDRYERTVGVVVATEEDKRTHAAGFPFHVADDGAWIELHDGRHVHCDRRLATQRLLAALAKARRERPGRAIAMDELITAGWPGERLQAAAGKNRLRVALSWLRKNGLGQALASATNGYFLNPVLVDVTKTRDALSDPQRPSTHDPRPS